MVFVIQEISGYPSAKPGTSGRRAHTVQRKKALLKGKSHGVQSEVVSAKIGFIRPKVIHNSLEFLERRSKLPLAQMLSIY